MDDAGNLLLFGASTRAAAFSALRAGLRPWCADLFADLDLRARCPVRRPPGRYPHSFLDLIDADVPGPWMYTGGLESWPGLVAKMARRRPLWGNGAAELRRTRNPGFVREILRRAGLPVPALATADAKSMPGRRWLAKPLRGAGGTGIHVWDPREREPAGTYLQEFIEGKPCAALYVGNGRSARFLGLTEQLVGEPWLHAAPFQYCGSISPLGPREILDPALEELGSVLAAACGLRGLVGVDGVLRQGTFWPVEVNPRYTASVEVLEHATGLLALDWHRRGCTGESLPSFPEARTTDCVGKAILFAREDISFPADGPWLSVLRSPPPVSALPHYADIPPAGEIVRARRPVLTFFVRADSPDACREELRRRAADLDRRLYGR